MRSCIGPDPLGTVRKENGHSDGASENPEREPAVFRPEDEIGGSRLLHERTRIRRGRVALVKDVLRSAARKALQIDHPVFEHMAECSACYPGLPIASTAGSRAWSFWLRPAPVAAAVVLMTVAGVTNFGRNRVTGLPSDTQSNAITQPLLIDYRGEGTTRSEAGDLVSQICDRAPCQFGG